MKNLVNEFVEYNKLLIVGVIAGIISGIFFSVYSDLRPKLNDNAYALLSASLFVTVVWYFIIMIISFIIYQIWKKT